MRLYFTLSLFLLLIASPGIGRDTVESKKKAKWKNACSDILIRPNQKHKYFRLALNYENRDSFIMALRIYTVLKRLSPDTNTVFMRKVKASYVETEKKELVVLKNRLLGKYTWTWSGSNWGTDDEPEMCKCTRSLKIENDSMSFYSGDTLTRKTNFWLMPKRNWCGCNDDNLISLQFGDDAEKEWFVELNMGQYYMVKPGAITVTYEKKGWTCTCGCYQEVYAPAK